MIYPEVSFYKNSKQDFETLLAFAKDAKYSKGRTLEWAIFNKYSHLKSEFDESYRIKNKQSLRYFIEEEYRIRGKSMDRAIKQHKKRWEKIAPRYFALVDNLFKGRKWPRGKYIAFGTIWGMYPRFLESKTFQIPYWHRKSAYVSVVVAHEMLHFIFYDYFYKRHPEYRPTKNNLFIWHVSEIFNTIIQNSPLWLKLFKLESLGYPEHEKAVKHLSKAFYREEWNIDRLTDEILKEVMAQKLA